MEEKVKEKKKVFVGLSGGVDSAVAAALLKKQGYDVVGVFMRFWKNGQASQNACCSVESEAAALAIAQKLQISFYIFNFAKEFKREVVDYFLAELSAGHTPNPCAVCNPKIKFGLFLARAKKFGADFVATGHYARIVSIPDVILRAKPEGSLAYASRHSSEILPPPLRGQNDILKYKLFVAEDKQKDQSYFLVGLSQEQLSKIIFPLGDRTKNEVYKLAKKWRLPHQSRQSFDICFAGDYREFLKKYVKMKAGKVVNLAGRKIGQPSFAKASEGKHQGLPFYTIGQRAGIGGPGPFYVVKKNAKKNILYVSNNERDLYQKEMIVENVNWLSGRKPKLPLRCKVKIRYQGEVVTALLRLPWTSLGAGRSGQKLQVIFEKLQRAITPGQYAVFYNKDGEVLGGGVIL